jgi:hypothetical protein
MTEQLEITRAQLRDVIEHFNAAPTVSNEALFEYCTRMGYPTIGNTTYEDWRFQYLHDQRATVFVQAVLKILSRYQHISNFGTQEERERMVKENEALSVDICQAAEESGILYENLDFSIALKDLESGLGHSLRTADARIENMAKNTLREMAESQLGSPLSIKALGEENRKRHPVPPPTGGSAV